MAILSELFDSRIREVRSPRLGTFTIGATSNKCLSARKSPSDINATAKVNNLAFFFAAVDKNQIYVGIDNVDRTTFLIRKDGSTPQTSFRAVVNLKKVTADYGDLYITTDQSSPEMAGAIKGIAIGVVFTGMHPLFPNYSNTIGEELRRHIVSVSFDAFYYDVKNSPWAETKVEMTVAKDEVDIAFAKEGTFSPLETPDELKSLVGKDFYPFMGKECASKESSAESNPDKEAEEFMEECRLSKYRLFDVFFADSARIPDISVLDTYAPSIAFKYNLIRMYKVLSEAFGMNPNGIPTGNKVLYAKDMSLVMNMMFFGPPGTGKSHMCTAIGAALGVPVYQFTVSGGAEEGTFDKMPTYANNGGIMMATQPFRDGYEKGGIIVVDEVNAAKPDVLISLNGALERPYLLGAGTDDQVKRHAATIIVATCNPGTEGVKLQNTAFYNRFRHWTEFEPTTREQLIKMIRAQRKDLDFSHKKVSDAVNKILDIYDFVVDGLTKQMSEMNSLSTVLSLRSIIGVVENYFDFGTTLKDAIIESLISPVQYFVQEGNDEDTKDEFNDRVLAPLYSKLSAAGFQKKYGTGN